MIGKDLKRLFLEHRRELQTYLTRHLRDREIAADLTQETFLRFAEQGSRTTIVDDRSYLYRTAKNLAIDHVRRISRQRTDATTHDDLADIPEDRPDSEQILAGRQRLDRLRAVIEELPTRTRQVFVLNRIEGLTYSEVARRLGISVSSVQKDLTSALQHVLRRTGPP